jgi:hypothetical protein
MITPFTKQKHVTFTQMLNAWLYVNRLYGLIPFLYLLAHGPPKKTTIKMRPSYRYSRHASFMGLKNIIRPTQTHYVIPILQFF